MKIKAMSKDGPLEAHLVNFYLDRILSLTRIWKHYERHEEHGNCGHGVLCCLK